MKQGYTVAKDVAGNPSLLADCRTPIWEQEKQMRLLKAGKIAPPDGADSVELICTERGVVSKWKSTHSVAASKQSEPETKKKGRK